MKSKNKKATAHDNIKILVGDEIESKPSVPLTGADVAQMFAERRNSGKWEQYFLREVEGDSYRYRQRSFKLHTTVPGN